MYELLDRLGGGTALRLHVAVLTALLALAGWALTRAAEGVTTRVVVVTPFLVMGVLGWSHRPFLFGFLCLAAVLLAMEGRFPTPWLLAVGWIWLNTHGSWPLGLLAIGVSIVGRRLDRERVRTDLDALKWFAGGLAVGCLNPYGPRLLTFPLTALERQEVFREIREWRPPTFERPAQLAFLAVLAIALVALRRSSSWRLTLTIVVFGMAALLSARNLPVASIVFLPVTAKALATRGVEVPPLLTRAAPALAASVAAIGVAVAGQAPAFGETIYPVAAAEVLAERGLDPANARWVTQDFVGNWIEWRFGPEAKVFIDDRFEVIPVDVVEDYQVLLDGGRRWREVLAEYEPDAVVWQNDRPLAALLDSSRCWEIVHRDTTFVAAVPVVDRADCAG